MIQAFFCGERGIECKLKRKEFNHHVSDESEELLEELPEVDDEGGWIDDDAFFVGPAALGGLPRALPLAVALALGTGKSDPSRKSSSASVRTTAGAVHIRCANKMASVGTSPIERPNAMCKYLRWNRCASLSQYRASCKPRHNFMGSSR